jgi:UDP-GlcNAc:undecaprenyl-phosphate GlcNAc-1-phosphate transferase
VPLHRRPQWRRIRRLSFVAAAVVCASLGLFWIAGTTAAAVLAGCAVLAWMLTPLAARLAVRLGAVVRPGGRAVHRRTTPLMGGLAIVVPLLLVGLLVGAVGWSMDLSRWLPVLLGATLVAGVGCVDDLRTLGWKPKVLVQVFAGVLLVLGGWGLETLSFGVGPSLDLASWGPVLTVLWVVCATNAFNLVDGMDGLCASLTALAALVAAAWGADVLLCAVVAGASLGFLQHNLPVARTFLGDTGSQLLGFLVAVLALDLPVAGNVPLALALVAYPAGDVTVAVIRRWLRAKPLFVGDGSHVHHKALLHLGNARRALPVLLAFAGAHLLVAHLWPGPVSLALSLLLWASAVITVAVAGQIGIRMMLKNRHGFRRLHALRDYVTSLIGLARNPSEVSAALTRLGADLRLHTLTLDSVGVFHTGQPAALGIVTVDVPLHKTKASWSYVPCHMDLALDREMRSVVCDLLRRAQIRVIRLERSARRLAQVPLPPLALPPPPAAPPPTPVHSPSTLQ